MFVNADGIALSAKILFKWKTTEKSEKFRLFQSASLCFTRSGSETTENQIDPMELVKPSQNRNKKLAEYMLMLVGHFHGDSSTFPLYGSAHVFSPFCGLFFFFGVLKENFKNTFIF